MQSKFTEVANRIKSIKSNLAQAITAKGVETSPSAAFGEMVSNISKITTESEVPSVDIETEWIRPLGWPNIEEEPLEPGEIRFLVSDYLNDGQNYLNISTTCRVDWGDGTVDESISSKFHTFNPDAGILTPYGYRVYVVKIKADNGQPLTKFNYYRNVKHTPILWFYGDMQAFTELDSKMFGALDQGSLIRRVRFENADNITNINCFRNLKELESVVGLKFGSLTMPCSYFLYNANSLRHLDCELKDVKITDGFGTLKRLSKIDGFICEGSNSFKECLTLSSLGKVTLLSSSYLKVEFVPITSLEIAYDSEVPPVFDKTTPLKINYTQMGAEALNALMESLPDGNGKNLDIKNNPGTSSCDTSIATKKNWTVLV